MVHQAKHPVSALLAGPHGQPFHPIHMGLNLAIIAAYTGNFL